MSDYLEFTSEGGSPIYVRRRAISAFGAREIRSLEAAFAAGSFILTEGGNRLVVRESADQIKEALSAFDWTWVG